MPRINKIEQVIDAFYKIASSARKISIPTSQLRLPPAIVTLFKDKAELFNKNTNLWIKGGPARETLLTYVMDKKYSFQDGRFQRQMESPRDIDLVLVSPDAQQRPEITNSLPPNYDLEIVSSIEDYFNTRDLTLNEVLLRPEELLFSDKALNSIIRNKSIPSAYEVNTTYKDVPPRIALRSVLISLRTGQEIPSFILKSIKYASPFDILVHLFKAFETNYEKEFYDIISQNNNAVTQDSYTPEELLLNLLNIVEDFKLIAREQEIVNRIIKDMNREYYEQQYQQID